ncbi:MAG: glycosyltransferase family 4 protein [Acidimicrobiia bacterium]|nr:glycosyltransferase family 4 protein [Acidimicrobiia bacterium]
MITKFVPLPADDGGKQRAFAILERLARRARVTLCAFDDGSADVAGVEDLGVEVRSVRWEPTVGRSLLGAFATGSISAGRFWDRRLANVVRSAGDRELDLLQVEYLQMAPYARGIKARRRVLDLHNIESELTSSYGRIAGWPRRPVIMAEAVALRGLERRACRDFDRVAVVSDRDRRRFAGHDGQVIVCPNGWDPGSVLPPAREPVVVFVATMGWPPNADAAVWFTSEVWPLVRARLPSARLMLVGRDPTSAVRNLGGPGVTVTGTVSDVAPFLAEARVAVAPLRAGGGSRLKILEALDAGRPVVATAVGAEGLEDLRGEGVVVAEGREPLARAVGDLLGDPDSAARLGQRGHEAVARRYDWDRTLRPLLDGIAT